MIITPGIGDGSVTTSKIAASAVTESKIGLSDNTTDDVSTTKHGFVPKAPNDTSKFLRGDATWASAPVGNVVFVGKTVLGSGNTTISVTGLDLNTDGFYMFAFSTKINSGSGSNVMLEANADTTATNYYTQTVRTYAGSNIDEDAGGNNPNFANAVSANENMVGKGFIQKALDGSKWGDIDAQGNSGANREMIKASWRWTNTATNMTSLQIVSDNAFQTGSALYVWKVTAV